jgi:L-glutamine-phosphate cytidylyltransferase
MKAILLAAGRGSRMQHLTEAAPKCLVKLHGRTLLEWQLSTLRAANITDIAIVTGYKRELLAKYKLVEFHNPRWESTNMVSSLACAESWLQSGPCLVSYTDIFYQPKAALDIVDSSASLAITYDPNWRGLWEKRFDAPLSDAETFRLDAEGNLAEIGQPPVEIDAIQGQYMGLLRFTPAAWLEVERIRAGLPESERDKMHMTGTLQKIIEAGRLKIAAIPYRSAWSEVDNQHDLEVAEQIASAVELN